MKDIPQQFDNILIRNNFWKKSFDYFFEYQWNNIYHIQFVEFYNLYLSEEEKHKELTEFLFENIKFHEILINYLNQDNIDEKEKEKIIPKQRLKFSFKSGKAIYINVQKSHFYWMKHLGCLSRFDFLLPYSSFQNY